MGHALAGVAHFASAKARAGSCAVVGSRIEGTHLAWARLQFVRAAGVEQARVRSTVSSCSAGEGLAGLE